MKAFTFMAEEELLKEFKKACKEKDTTASQELRRMIRDFIKDQK